MKSHNMLVGILVMSLLNIGCSILGVRTVEEPEYKVLSSDGDIEIRQYKPQIIAKTISDRDMDSVTNQSFQKIAKYIFGENEVREPVAVVESTGESSEGQPVAMTAPVVQANEPLGSTMYFIMPAKYTMETLPKPKSKDVIIEELPAQKVAVLKYSGFAGQEKLRAKEDILKAWLSEKDYIVSSEARSARYDPPWTLPFLRRNEVHITLQDK